MISEISSACFLAFIAWKFNSLVAESRKERADHIATLVKMSENYVRIMNERSDVCRQERQQYIAMIQAFIKKRRNQPDDTKPT